MVRVHDVVIIGCGTSATFAAIRLLGEEVDVAVVSAGAPSAVMSRGLAFVGRAFPDEPAFERLWREVLPGMWQEHDTYLCFDGAAVEASRGLAHLASLGRAEGNDVLVMDVPGLPGPSAEVVAWRIGEALGRKVRPSTLKLQYKVQDFGMTPVLWARRLDDEKRRAELAAHLARRMHDDPADLYLLPPLLGITGSEIMHRILDTAVKGRVLELAGGPGWPPGLRVAEALGEALRGSGAAMIRGRVVEARQEGGGIAAVVTDGGEEVRGRSYVLATGGLAGGGLRLEEEIRETALGLPLMLDGEWMRGSVGEIGVDRAALFDGQAGAAHPILGAGVHVDGSWRAMGPDGVPVHRNLWAAGSVVARCGGLAGTSVVDPGPSALSGWLAAGSVLSAGA